MNKGFFVVFLGIIVGAMALIFFNQASSPSSAPSGAVSVAQAPVTEPVKPEPVKPELSQPEPVKPEPAKPEVAKPEPVKPESVKPEPVKPALSQPEPVKPEVAKPEVAKPEPVKPEPAKPEAAKPAKPEAAKPAKPEQVKTVTPAPVKKSLALKNIGLQVKDKGIVLRIEADGGFSHKTFVLPSPDRFVVDLGGSWSGMRVPSVPSNNLVKSIRVGSQAGGPRLVLDMQRAPKKHRAVWAAPTVLEIYLE